MSGTVRCYPGVEGDGYDLLALAAAVRQVDGSDFAGQRNDCIRGLLRSTAASQSSFGAALTRGSNGPRKADRRRRSLRKSIGRSAAAARRASTLAGTAADR